MSTCCGCSRLRRLRRRGSARRPCWRGSHRALQCPSLRRAERCLLGTGVWKSPPKFDYETAKSSETARQSYLGERPRELLLVLWTCHLRLREERGTVGSGEPCKRGVHGPPRPRRGRAPGHRPSVWSRGRTITYFAPSASRSSTRPYARHAATSFARAAYDRGSRSSLRARRAAPPSWRRSWRPIDSPVPSSTISPRVASSTPRAARGSGGMGKSDLILRAPARACG